MADPAAPGPALPGASDAHTAPSKSTPIVRGTRRSRSARPGSSRSSAPPPKRARSVGRTEPFSDRLAAVKESAAHIRAARGRRSLSGDEEMLVVHVYLCVKERQMRRQQRAKARKKQKDISTEVSELTGYGRATVARVVAAYNKLMKAGTRAVGSVREDRRGNTMPKNTRVPLTQEVALCVREFVRERRKQKASVNSRHVMEHLVEKGHLTVTEDGMPSKREFRSALRATQRFIERMGYERGERRRDGQIYLKEYVKEMRMHYFLRLRENEALPPGERMRMVYLDESYVHKSYHRHEFNLYDPMDKKDKQQKLAHKGERYCIIAAIMGPDPSKRKEARTLQVDKAGLVLGSAWWFRPKKKDADTGDYHKNFNDENFSKWFSDLLDQLPRHRCLIVMDNAAYHKALSPENKRYRDMKKTELCAFAKEKFNLVFDSKSRKAGNRVTDIRNAVDQLMGLTAETTCERIIREFKDKTGVEHEILFQPPYHSDLQPIELVWAEVKGRIGRKFDAHTTMEDVLVRLKDEFRRLENDNGDVRDDGRTVVGAIIDHTDVLTKKFMDDDFAELAKADDGEADDVEKFPDSVLRASASQKKRNAEKKEASDSEEDYSSSSDEESSDSSDSSSEED